MHGVGFAIAEVKSSLPATVGGQGPDIRPNTAVPAGLRELHNDAKETLAMQLDSVAALAALPPAQLSSLGLHIGDRNRVQRWQARVAPQAQLPGAASAAAAPESLPRSTIAATTVSAPRLPARPGTGSWTVVDPTRVGASNSRSTPSEATQSEHAAEHAAERAHMLLSMHTLLTESEVCMLLRSEPLLSRMHGPAKVLLERRVHTRAELLLLRRADLQALGLSIGDRNCVLSWIKDSSAAGSAQQ